LFMLGCGVNATQPADDGGGIAVAAPKPAHDESLPDQEDNEILASVRKALSLKETEWPYFAEYELAVPEALRLAGLRGKRRIFAENRASLDAETVADAWSSRLLLHDNKLTLRNLSCVLRLDGRCPRARFVSAEHAG